MQPTTLTDRFGLALGTRSSTAVSHYVDGVDRMLALQVDPDTSFARAIEADEGFALAHAAAALTAQAQGQPEAAKTSVARAQALSPGHSRRERQHVEAVAAIVGGEGTRVLGLLREHLAEFPRDVLLLRQAGFLIQFGGGLRPREEFRTLLDAVAPAYGDDWSILDTLAFTHQEHDEFAEAQRLAERALAQNPHSALAVHTLAHVSYETNDHTGGVQLLGSWLADYEPRAPYHCHLSWHQALSELAVGHYGRMMDVYNRCISPVVREVRTTMLDAASLLWRCELYGTAATPLAWEPVRELAARQALRPGMAFWDVHAALALAGSGDATTLGQLVDGLRKLAANGHPLAEPVVLPLVQGVAAFAQADYAAAVRWLEPVMEQVVRVGGSNAQREVFADTLLEAYLRAGYYDQAEAMLRRRLQRRASARDFFWLGRAQAGRSQHAPAQASLDEAQRHWPDADSGAAELAALAAVRGTV